MTAEEQRWITRYSVTVEKVMVREGEETDAASQQVEQGSAGIETGSSRTQTNDKRKLTKSAHQYTSVPQRD